MDYEYLYCINDNGEDFITTSFSKKSVYNDNDSLKSKCTYIEIYNFDNIIDLNDVRYAAIDYTRGDHTHKASIDARYYKVKFISQDLDRKTANLKILSNHTGFNLQMYKRDVKIENIFKS